MPEQEKDAQFVEAVAKMLVEQPDQVVVNRTIDDLGVLITLRVAAEDMSTIIGREGRAAKAVRTLLRIIGAKSNERVNLKIVEPDGSESVSRQSAETQTAPEAEPTEQVAEAPAEQPDESSSILDDIPAPLA